MIRSQGVGLDDFINRWTNRVLRRKGELPAGPPLLLPRAGALMGGSGEITVNDVEEAS